MGSFLHKTFSIFAITILLALPQSSFADTMSLSPSSGTYVVGQAFSVRVLVSSPNQAINAVSGVLSFPANLLQVTSVSKSGSIVSLWVQEPSFSNSQGIVSFEGVVPNPGFSRANGTAVTINFKVIGQGSADLRFTSGSLLANDGLGTNILRTLGTASFNLAQKPATPSASDSKPSETSADSEPSYLDLNDLKESDAEGVKAEPLSVPPVGLVSEWFLNIMSVAIPLLALMFLSIYIMQHGIHKVKKNNAQLKREIRNIDKLVEKSFDLLKEDIADSIHMLERAKTKRELTKEEDEIISRLRQNLNDAEKVIHKEVLKAEKHL